MTMLSGKLKHKLAWLMVFAGIFLLIGVQAFAAEIDLIQQAIRTKQAKWVAKENPISRLPAAARKRLLGARSQDLDTGAPMMDPYAALGPIPAAYDWRSVGGKNFVTPVRNQNPCGSCWVFGPVAALEAKCLITFNWPGQDLNLSEQIVLSCSGGGDCDAGGYASVASDYLKNTGTSVETCYPYTATNGACSNACPNWQSKAYKIASWQYVSIAGSATAAMIKNAIYNGGPVVAWFNVYEDFLYYSSGVYTQTWGVYKGSHFVLVTGYDDALGAFIVKNSWDTTWGDAGYFKIAYSEISGYTYFGYWTYGYGKAINPDKPHKANPWLLLMLD
jgi:C1A family cysteine protease